ncbi:uncharacterized protein LOC143211601 [Lasioglossum baleicum]|uniref:uncharacterized protein LOC143211601 n=1 Tax=Lasioglossum baleicum TaxID=434251 RepID=UPI003FCDC9F3
MKPPKVELPKFSGDYTEWEGFHDLFIALVEKNKSLSDVQKLYYLKTSLEGEAAFVLKNIATSKDPGSASRSAPRSTDARKPNDDETHLFHTNERSLVKAHLKMLFDSPPIGVNVLTDLKSLRDRSNAALLALKNLGRKVNSILLTGVRKGEQGALIAQNTIFGWVLTGPIQPSNEHVTHLHALHAEVHNEINEMLHKFWEVEATPQINFLSEEDKKCEEHFVKPHSRESDGKYVVWLPINTESPIDIGFTRNVAVKSFYNLEKRLKNNPVQASSYHGFLQEYLDLNHMREESAIDSQSTQNVFLSHHPVIRHDSNRTRLRVVFNASMRTTNGSTLNDFLFVGPKLQADIVAIILKWRKSRFVFAADIAKMFRQIWVDPRDTHFQLIVWRSDPNHSLKNYALRTVTYGTASAPYLANRVIKQLAIDEGTNFPLATPILNEQIYVDDVLFGAHDRMLALQLRHQVTELLSRGGFHLRKFSSNCPRLLADISDQEHELASSRPFQEIEGVKMLGLFWVPSKDEFQFKFKFHFHSDQTDTKRTVLSTIARMFDPLGWISPVVITAKIFMQKLWSAKLNWDDPLPVDLQQPWNVYSAELKELPLMTIPRWIGLGTSTLNYEIHGFADASQHAYAAVIFLRVVTIPDQTSLHLLIAQTKVAPLKPLTIPRLELLAAVIMCWTDSAVALAWIHKHPSQLKTFTAHRVAEIQSRVPNAIWRHVPPEFNPADCASRGLTVSQLSTHQLWWCGPSWLMKPPNEWPNLMPTPPNEVKEEIKISVKALHAQAHVEWDLPTRVSSWLKLLRVTAYIFRFVSRCQAKDTVFLDYVINAKEINEAPDCHQNILHGGTQLTLSIVRQVFWIINSRRIVRRLIHKCVKCVRARATTAQQQMGDLPKVRVTPSRPFSHTQLNLSPNASKRIQVSPNASKRIQISPNASKRIQVSPNASKRIQVSPNASKRIQVSPNASKRIQVSPNASNKTHAFSLA